MSGFKLVPDDRLCAFPSLPARINGAYSDSNMISSDETGPEERSLYQESGVLSQSSAPSDERSGEPVPTTSTPDLSFTTSSSPCRFNTKGSPSFHTTSSDHLRCRNVTPLFKPTSDHTTFARRLDYLLQRATNQPFKPRSSENTRIQLDLLEEIPVSVSQMDTMAYDKVTVSAHGLADHDSRCSALPLQRLQRTSSLAGGISDDNTLATASYEAQAGHDSGRNKRKDSYLSASDVASPVLLPCSKVYPPLKKRKHVSLDVSQSSVVSPRTGSPVVPDTNLIHSKPSSFMTNQCSDLSATHLTSKGVQYPSPPPSLSQGGQGFEIVALSRARSALESDFSYPPTEIATPPGPVPILGLRDFPKVDIPRAFWSSDDAAEARLMSLLRKEARHPQRQDLNSFVDLDLALKDTFCPEVMAWILNVEPPLGSPTDSSIRGRAYSHDLHEQLTVHHDSRFLAALIFSLFFFHQVKGSEVSRKVDQSDTSLYKVPKGGENMVIWDYAVAAIALAVKMHRDSYPPLKPIFGHHFLALAHHEIRFEDLELAQRRLLRHFSYNLLLPTPQEFLEELPLVLPALRHALGSERAWKDVLNETWKLLIAGAHWPSMLRFPVSLLTATALSHAIKGVVHRRLPLLKGHLEKAVERPDCPCDCHMKTTDLATGGLPLNTAPEREQSYSELSILRSMSAVLEDIHEVLGLSVGKTEECEEWLAQVREASEKPQFSKYFRDIPT